MLGSVDRCALLETRFPLVSLLMVVSLAWLVVLGSGIQ